MKFPVVFLCCALPALAADPRGDNPDAPASTAQEQLTKFKVPPGFEVQLVADESQIQKPMNLNFDAAGRLWVTGSELYPWAAKLNALGRPIEDFDKVWASTSGSFNAKKAPPPPERATDTVRVLSDFGPDGRARKVQVFADGLNIPIGVQPLPRKPGGWKPLSNEKEKKPQLTQIGADDGKAAPTAPKNSSDHPSSSAASSDAGPKGDSVIVYSIPNIWLMTDWDGDGKADKREPLYTGFDFRDTHGMSSNYYYWIDGWIYGCHGFANKSEVKDRQGRVTSFHSGNTYRFRPDGSQIEYWSHGQTNPFGLCFDELGNLYSADSHSKPVMLLLRGGYYEGIGKQHDGLGFAPRITDDDHGSSSIAGIAYYADDKWPEEFRGNLFNGNPVTRSINRAKLDWRGSSPRATRLEDFVTCDDPWFRPVQVKLGPDGALWIADFYNPIIGHYEAPLADPRRDHTHGRIWRVIYRGGEATTLGSTGGPPGASGVAGATTSEKTNTPSRPDVAGGPPATTGQRPVLPIPAPPDLTALDAAGLVEKLADSSLIVRTLATHELAERAKEQAAAALRGVIARQSRDRPLRSADAESSLPVPVEYQGAHAFWALERITGASDVEAEIFARNTEYHFAMAVQVLARRPDASGDHLRKIGVFPKGIETLHPQTFRSEIPTRELARAFLSRSFIDFHATHPSIGGLFVAAAVPIFEKDDPQKVYAASIAIRETLKSPHGYAWARSSGEGEYIDAIAKVSLAVPGAASADFLLTHLRRTKFSTPRAGEYSKHAALHLPPEKFGEVASLTSELNDAPFTQKLALAEGLGTASRERKLALPEAATAWVQRVSLEALKSEDSAVLDRAIVAVRDAKSPEKAEPLRAIVLRGGHGPRRAAALEALMNLPEGVTTAVQALADPSSMTLRKKAADALAGAGNAEARAALLASLPTAPQELAASLAAGLAKSQQGAALLVQAVEEGRASATLLRQKAVATALAQSVPGTPELDNRVAALVKDLPPEDARLDGIIAQRVEAYRAAKPDAKHGVQVFQQACAVCHRFRNEGGNVGPNLDGMAARGPHRLIEDIFDPNRNVDPAFRQTIIETNDGQTFAGANVREQGATVLLTDVTGRDVAVPKNAIKTQTQSRLSLMPPAFEAQLAPGDFNDLLAYLLGAVK